MGRERNQTKTITYRVIAEKRDYYTPLGTGYATSSVILDNNIATLEEAQESLMLYRSDKKTSVVDGVETQEETLVKIVEVTRLLRPGNAYTIDITRDILTQELYD